MRVSFRDQWTGGIFASADYQNQSITFFGDTKRLSADALDFAVAHEFGHLTPENFALRPKTFGDALVGSGPREAHADEFARRILNLQVNPKEFRDMSRRR